MNWVLIFTSHTKLLVRQNDQHEITYNSKSVRKLISSRIEKPSAQTGGFFIL